MSFANLTSPKLPVIYTPQNILRSTIKATRFISCTVPIIKEILFYSLQRARVYVVYTTCGDDPELHPPTQS